MKTILTAAPILSMLLLAACAGKFEATPALLGGVQANDVTIHSTDSCPAINGVYSSASAESAQSQEFKTVVGAGGMTFSADDFTYSLNGKVLETKNKLENKVVTYTAICSNKSILIDYFDGAILLGKKTFALNEKNQVVVSNIAIDARLGVSTTDTLTLVTEKAATPDKSSPENPEQATVPTPQPPPNFDGY